MNPQIRFQIESWYGPPGSHAASVRGVHTTLIGVSQHIISLAAHYVAQGQSIGLISGGSVHKSIPHPASERVSHAEFYRAAGLSVPAGGAAEIWNDRGDILYVLGWKIEALECFFRALSIDSGCVGAWVNLSRYFMDPEVRDFAAATLCAESALEIDKRCDMALANLGAIALVREDFAEAISHCRRAVEINNGNFFAHYYLAGALMKAGDHRAEKKQEILRHALRCRDLLAQCPAAAPSIAQMIAWCRQS